MANNDALTPRVEIERRVERFQQMLRHDGIDGALVLQPTDRFYFSGTLQQAQIYIPADGTALLLVRKDLSRAEEESPLERIAACSGLRRLPEMLAAWGYRSPRRLGLEFDVLPTRLYLDICDLFQSSEPVDVSNAIRSLRAVKSAHEIKLLREAGRLCDIVMAGVPELLEEGIAEVELAGKVEALARGLGHQGIVRMRMWGSELFYGHLMAGPPAAMPSYLSSPTGGPGLSPAVPQSASFRKIRRNEPVLVDYVFARQGYLADTTRIFSIGPLPEDLTAAHEAVLDLNDRLRLAARPGVLASDLYAQALDTMTRGGYRDYFMGGTAPRAPFVGHGVGLELDEYPVVARGQEMALESNMVVALEPKLVFPRHGVVGIENTHLVTAAGLESFTQYPEAVCIV